MLVYHLQILPRHYSQLQEIKSHEVHTGKRQWRNTSDLKNQYNEEGKMTFMNIVDHPEHKEKQTAIDGFRKHLEKERTFRLRSFRRTKYFRKPYVIGYIYDYQNGPRPFFICNPYIIDFIE